jgi:hypothetical protein
MTTLGVTISAKANVSGANVKRAKRAAEGKIVKLAEHRA